VIRLTDKEITAAGIEIEVEDGLADYGAAKTTDVTAVGTQVAVVDGVVDLIPSSTGTLSWNATALAAIQSEADDALVARGLDHLTVVADATLATVTDDTVIAHMLAVDGDVSDFDDNTMSLEALNIDTDAIITKQALIQPDSAKNLSTIEAELDAMLDVGEGASETLVMDGTEQTVHSITGQSVPFFFAGGFFDWTGLNAGGGVNTTIKVKVKVDGTNYRVIYEETFLTAVVPSPACTPFPRENTAQPTPSKLYSLQDVIVTAQQAAVGAGWNTLKFNVIDAKPGG